MHSSSRHIESLQSAARHSWCARAHRHSSRTTCQPVIRLAPAQAASEPLPALTSAESDTSNGTTISRPGQGQSHPTVKGISPVQLLSGSAEGGRVSATGAAAAAALNTQSQSHPRWRTLLPCTLLAAAAVAVAPALLLLDTAEQAILGWDRLKQHASFALAQARSQHSQQQQQQSPVGGQRMPRPLLPLWPPVVHIIVAVAPLGLLLLSQCRQACLAPALLLGASLLLQAYLNLQLTVFTRVRGRAATAAPAAWAATPSTRTAAAAAASLGAEAAAGVANRWRARASWSATAAVKLFAWLQVAGDALRLICCGWMAWMAVHATAVQAASQPDHAAILWGALQRCLQPTDLGQTVAAASAAAVALQHLVQLWWGSACIVAVCCGSAAVYGLSAFAHCNVGW